MTTLKATMPTVLLLLEFSSVPITLSYLNSRLGEPAIGSLWLTMTMTVAHVAGILEGASADSETAFER